MVKELLDSSGVISCNVDIAHESAGVQKWKALCRRRQERV